MAHLIHAFTSHPYVALFLTVLGERLGLPILVTPVLLAAGAFGGSGKLNFTLVIFLSVAASLLGDLALFWMGRWKGTAILGLMCRISIEPDSCVRRSKRLLGKNASWVLLFSKYVPGVAHIVPPLAGLTNLSKRKFLLLDGIGCLLFVVPVVLTGFLSGRMLKDALSAAGIAKLVVAIIVVVILGNLLWKYIKKKRFLRELRMARITPHELKTKVDAGEKVSIIDLRDPSEVAGHSVKIPNALHYTAEQLLDKHGFTIEVEEVILYCT